MKLNFPKDFLWGGAVSAEQTEGKGTTRKGQTIFEKHFLERPKDFYKEIGPDKTIDWTRKYKQDIAMLRDLKINSHRTSISWARIFPDGNYTNPSKEGVQFYHDMIDEFHKNGIELILTIYHFDMPMYAMQKGGFESREVWDDFKKYAAFIFNEYGAKVKMWTTMNEPWVPVQASYISGIQYPFVKNEQRAINVAYGIVMAHAYAVNYFNEFIKPKFPKNIIGAIFNSSIVYPRDKNNQEDVIAAKYLDLFQFTGLTDAMIAGKWNPEIIEWVKEMDMVPENYQPIDISDLAKVKIDLVGLNYYAPQRATAPSNKPKNKFEQYFSVYEMPGRRENKFRGWEIYPEALYDTFKLLLQRYGSNKKYMLTEYGFGVQDEARFRNKKTGSIEDNYRVAFIKEHLLQLHKIMQDTNINMIGAHHWAAFDCWSWNNAFKNTYGLIEVDLATQKRIPKASANFLKEVIENNGFDDQFNRMEHYMNFDDFEIIEPTKL